MPGIAGIISGVVSAEHATALRVMLDSMLHEPTYVSGTCLEPDLGIYSGWVAHPGSFAAKASGVDETHDVALAFSGECFADSRSAPLLLHQDPRAWVASRYRQTDDGCVTQLNGLFAGILIDRRRRCAVLFNDRYGLERIYVHENNGTTYFASEAKALLRVVPQLRAFDETGIAQYLAFGCTLEQTTLFRGVSLLPPASCWRFEPGLPSQKRIYFSPHEWETQEPLAQSQFESAFAETFRRILPKYVTDPDRLGLSLTGGLDTRMIVACLPETTIKPSSYTFSGRIENTLDGKLAARIAKACGITHRLLRIGDDFLHRFGEFVDKSVYVSDGCCAATGAHEIYLNHAAAKLAPIRLTGNFGSEVLRSASTFKPLHLDTGSLSANTRAAVTTASTVDPSRASHPVTFAAFREIPWNLVGTLLTGRSQVTFRTPYLDNELVALAYRAPTTARNSPLPALRIIEQASPELSRIPTDRGHIGTSRGPAWLLRRVVAEATFKLDYYHKEGLPGALAPLTPLLNALAPTGVLGLHKFLPYSRWFRGELKPYLEDVLTDHTTRDLPFFTAPFLESMVEAHARGVKNYTREINAVLALEAVERTMFKEQPSTVLPK